MKNIIERTVKAGMTCETFTKDIYVALTEKTWFCAAKSSTKTTNEIYYLGRKIKEYGKIIAKRRNLNKDWELN